MLKRDLVKAVNPVFTIFIFLELNCLFDKKYWLT